MAPWRPTTTAEPYLSLVDRLGADPISMRSVGTADRTLVVEVVASADPYWVGVGIGSGILHPQIASQTRKTSSPKNAAKMKLISASGYRYGRRL